jgi:nucleotide-binding universal stress UspA family protein
MGGKMNKVLISADNVRGSEEILSSMNNVVTPPDSIILLHVQQLVGNSTMTAMMSYSEIETMKESIEGTEHKEALDRRAERVLAHYRKALEDRGLTNIKCVIKSGHPADEILQVAEEEKVDLIIVGCSGKSRIRKFTTGCTSRDVEKNSKVRVLITKNNGCGKHAHMWTGREAYALQ